MAPVAWRASREYFELRADALSNGSTFFVVLLSKALFANREQQHWRKKLNCTVLLSEKQVGYRDRRETK
jgi:hypothetical protein